MSKAETHWQLGELNEGKHKFIMQSLRELIQDRGDRQQELQGEEDAAGTPEADGDSRRVQETDSSRPCILCLPARSEADEIAALMLSQVLETAGCLVRAVSVTSLAEEMADIVDQHTVDVVCVSATPPAAVMHARYLYRRLRNRLPKVHLVVGLWDAQGDLSKAKERIGCGAIVVTTMAEAQVQIRQLLQPRLAQLERQAPGATKAGAISELATSQLVGVVS